MFNLADIFTKMAGGAKFANNPANGFATTFGDNLQGIGHSMLQHYRGKGGEYGGPGLIPGVTTNGAGIPANSMSMGLDLGALMAPPAPAGPQVNPMPQMNFGGGVTGGPLAPARNARMPFRQEMQQPSNAWGLGSLF